MWPRGLCDEVGRPAISPSARQQIMNSNIEGLEETGLDHVQVELNVPRGLELAKETLNPELGIMGGISILGSTGFVEPWNDHFIERPGPGAERSQTGGGHHRQNGSQVQPHSLSRS